MGGLSAIRADHQQSEPVLRPSPASARPETSVPVFIPGGLAP